MKKYKAYTARKLKFPRRLLFFLAVAVIIFILAVVAGNKLRDRVESITSKDAGTTYDLETEKAQLDTTIQTVEHDGALSMVTAGHFNTAAVTDDYTMRAEVTRLLSEGCNAISFVANSDDGSFTYASPALQGMTRLPASEKLFSFSLLTSAVECARYSGMRTSAVLYASGDTEIDSAVAAELSAAGFDEFLITGFENEKPGDDSAARINGYVDALRKAAPADYGVLLSPDTFSDSKNAPFIERIFARTEFLAIDMRNADSKAAASLTDKLQGSFSAYMLRPLLNGDNAENTKAVSDALSKASVNARQYVSSPRKAADTTEPTTYDEDE